MQAPAFRARSVPELLDAAFQVLRARYAQLLSATLVICLPAFVLDLFIPAEAGRLSDVAHSFLLSYAAAATVVVVSDAYLGQERSLPQVLRAVFSRFGSIWGTALMKNLLIGFGMLLLVVPGVIAFIVTFAMVPAVMLEGASTSQAFDRSRALARGNQARIFFALVLAFALMSIAFMGTLFAAGFLEGTAGWGMSDTGWNVLTQLVFSAAYPFTAIVSVLLYYDARIRNEAFDIEMLMEDLHGLAPAEAPPVPA
ncbi:MAG: hypothetical protein ACJ8GN_12130 [Longimicrobiaceae bacterium]